MSLLDILKQYASPSAVSPGEVPGHFDTVAAHSTPDELGPGIASAMRSNATPSFAQTIGGLFDRSNPSQKAGVLNELVQALGAGGVSAASGGILGKILGGNSSGSALSISPTQAAQVSPAEVSSIAATAQQQNDSIVDRLGSFYAQHPTLVKTLGVAALGAVMSHMSQQRPT